MTKQETKAKQKKHKKNKKSRKKKRKTKAISNPNTHVRALSSRYGTSSLVNKGYRGSASPSFRVDARELLVVVVVGVVVAVAVVGVASGVCSTW